MADASAQTDETARTPLIPPDIAARVGSVAVRATGTILRRDWQRWAYAVGDENPLYFDSQYARAAGYADVICPPLYVQYATLGAVPLWSLRPDGSSGSGTGDLVFPDCPRRMAGGESTEFLGPGYHDDEVTLVRTIDSIVEKQGRSGRFVLVTWRAEYTTGDGRLLASASTSMIARP